MKRENGRDMKKSNRHDEKEFVRKKKPKHKKMEPYVRTKYK